MNTTTHELIEWISTEIEPNVWEYLLSLNPPTGVQTALKYLQRNNSATMAKIYPSIGTSGRKQHLVKMNSWLREKNLPYRLHSDDVDITRWDGRNFSLWNVKVSSKKQSA